MTLKILVGPPCSGKTTYTQNHENHKIVSSDEEIELIKNNNFSQNKLNILGVENGIIKINNFLDSGFGDIIFDSTNLTKERRLKVLSNIKNIEFEAINLITDFNIIYSNWEKRGKDIKEAMLLYFYIIFQKAEKNEGFSIIDNIISNEESDLKYLKMFLNREKVDKQKILDENKELKILYTFWKKGGKDFFDEYENKLSYLEDMTLEDKLALLYSDIKYFYLDFINELDLTYVVSYEDFINGFIQNIFISKIKGLIIDKEKSINSFNKLILLF